MANKHKKDRTTASSKLNYRSDLERRLHEGPLKGFKYEPFKRGYVLVKDYIPDFVCPDNDNIWIEAKGRFRDYGECQKYVALKETYPDVKLIFVFQNPKAKAYQQTKRRKDGTYLSLAEWATLNGFEYYDTVSVKGFKC